MQHIHSKLTSAVLNYFQLQSAAVRLLHHRLLEPCPKQVNPDKTLKVEIKNIKAAVNDH